MKIVSLHELPEEPSSHHPDIRRRVAVRRHELPPVTHFAQARLAPGQAVARHRHADMAEVFLVEAGEGEVEIDGGRWVVTPGVCVVVEAGESHALRCRGGEPLVLTYFGIEQGPVPTRPIALSLLEGRFAVCRLPPSTSLRDLPLDAPWITVSRTPDELSVVCPEETAPREARVEGGWRCLRVPGTLGFEETGILAALTAPLAAAEVGVFAVSTFDTDYLLVQEEQLEPALAAWRAIGIEVS